MITFDDMLNEQMQNEEFRKEYDVNVIIKMYIFANLNMTINFPPLLNQFFLLYDKIVL